MAVKKCVIKSHTILQLLPLSNKLNRTSHRSVKKMNKELNVHSTKPKHVLQSMMKRALWTEIEKDC